MINSATTVRHVTKDHVVIMPATGYSVTVFNVSEGVVEAVVAAADGSETIRLLVEPPGPGRTMSVRRDDFGVIDILYSDKASG